MPAAARQLKQQQYDLSMFEKAPVRQPAELRVIKREQVARRDVTLRIVLTFVLALAVSAMIIYNYMTLNELTSDINEAQAQYGVLQSEYRRLMVQSESQLSLRKIEEKAQDQMGMAPIESYQVEYIQIEDEEQVALAEASPGLFDTIKGGFASIVEYLGF